MYDYDYEPENTERGHRHRAKVNGQIMEDHILDMLQADHIDRPVDCMLDGVPMEIKSCQQTIVDKSFPNKTRNGRFWFDKNQHRYLLENDGKYAFVVHDNRDVIHTRILAAKRIGQVKGYRSIAWTKIMKM